MVFLVTLFSLSHHRYAVTFHSNAMASGSSGNKSSCLSTQGFTVRPDDRLTSKVDLAPTRGYSSQVQTTHPSSSADKYAP
jgi:hypothetical protein